MQLKDEVNTFINNNNRKAEITIQPTEKRILWKYGSKEDFQQTKLVLGASVNN